MPDGGRGPAGRPRHHRRARERRRRRPRPGPPAVLAQRRPPLGGGRRARRRRARSSRTTSTGPSRSATAPSHRVLAIRRGRRRGRPQLLDPAARGGGRRRILEAAVPAGVPGARRAGPAGGAGRLQAPAAAARWRPRRAPQPKKRADAAAIDVFAQQPAPAAAGVAARPEARAGASTPASAPAARRSCSTRRATCCTTTCIYPDQGAAAPARGGRRPCAGWSSATRSRRSPSATAPPGARPRPSSARLGLPPPSRS